MPVNMGVRIPLNAVKKKPHAANSMSEEPLFDEIQFEGALVEHACGSQTYLNESDREQSCASCGKTVSLPRALKDSARVIRALEEPWLDLGAVLSPAYVQRTLGASDFEDFLRGELGIDASPDIPIREIDLAKSSKGDLVEALDQRIRARTSQPLASWMDAGIRETGEFLAAVYGLGYETESVAPNSVRLDAADELRPLELQMVLENPSDSTMEMVDEILSRHRLRPIGNVNEHAKVRHIAGRTVIDIDGRFHGRPSDLERARDELRGVQGVKVPEQRGAPKSVAAVQAVAPLRPQSSKPSPSPSPLPQKPGQHSDSGGRAFIGGFIGLCVGALVASVAFAEEPACEIFCDSEPLPPMFFVVFVGLGALGAIIGYATAPPAS